MKNVKILNGDCLERMAGMRPKSVHCCVTSPPYWKQRDYQVEGQMGDEEHYDCLGWATGKACGGCFVCVQVAVFRAVKRVLRDDGTLWLNLGDKRKDHQVFGMPWRVALALQADGWLLRREVIWHKLGPMPTSPDLGPIPAHEPIFLLAKQFPHFYDTEAVRVKTGKEASWAEYEKARQAQSGISLFPGPGEPRSGRRKSGAISTLVHTNGANLRSVWPFSTESSKEKHFAMFPRELARRCILAGTSKHGVCADCGAPYTRVTESKRVATRPGWETKVTGDSKVDGNRDPQRHVTTTKTVGWAKGCDCQGERVVPATVFDPFLGSGTTAAVAIKYGRRAIGIELNAEYIEIARRRIAKAQANVGFGVSQ